MQEQKLPNAKVAEVTFFHQSGFMIAVEKTLLIFDYWRGEPSNRLPAWSEITEKDFVGFKQILVFVSHSHLDHYDEVIFDWDAKKYPITYILSDDIPKGHVEGRVRPGNDQQLGDVSYHVYESTDLGCSFYVKVGGICIFHAGDLNLWHWREESTLREIRQAEKMFYEAVEPIKHLQVDIALFPLDPRMGSFFDAGAQHFMLSVKPRVFIPMHWQNRREVSDIFARNNKNRFTEVVSLTHPRDGVTLTFTELELSVRMRHVYKNYEKNQSTESMPQENSNPFENSDRPLENI